MNGMCAHRSASFTLLQVALHLTFISGLQSLAVEVCNLYSPTESHAYIWVHDSYTFAYFQEMQGE